MRIFKWCVLIHRVSRRVISRASWIHCWFEVRTFKPWYQDVVTWAGRCHCIPHACCPFCSRYSPTMVFLCMPSLQSSLKKHCQRLDGAQFCYFSAVNLPKWPSEGLILRASSYYISIQIRLTFLFFNGDSCICILLVIGGVCLVGVVVPLCTGTKPAHGRRRVFSVRVIGDDVTHAPRSWVTSPPFPCLENTPAGAKLNLPEFPLLPTKFPAATNADAE